MTFPTFPRALEWARTHGADHCFPFQCWRVVADTARGVFRVAVYSRNDGRFCGYAQ